MMEIMEKIRKKMKNKRNFRRDKRAVSVALTTLIITAGVLAAGISILYWTYSWGNIANAEYSETVTNNQNSVGEKIAFEFAHYQNNKLSVYMINCGTTDGIKIARLYIWSNDDLIGTFTPDSPGLMNITQPNQSIPNNELNVGDEGFITITNDQLLGLQGFCTFRIVTERGRNFDGQFSAT